MRLRWILLIGWMALFGMSGAASCAESWSNVPGVVIDHRAASSGIYIGSPSIAILDDGRYIATHDEFGPKSGYYTGATTDVFESVDRGETWKQIATISDGALWSTVFVHRGALYLIGTTKEYGLLVIRRSSDGGRTWTTPKDGHNGLLAQGKWHTAPVPIVEHGGRLWRGVEDAMGGGGWGEMFRAHLLSVPADADLLEASNWTISEPRLRDPKWLNGTFKGWLEGNAVLAPSGEVVDFLRVAAGAKDSTIAAIIHASPDGKTLAFDPQENFTHDFPAGDKKFTIRFDPQTHLYWTLGNIVLPAFQNASNAGDVRNTVALLSSEDLRHWTVKCIVLYHPEYHKHGFQYLDWQFDGNDLIAVSRTAFDDGVGGAHRTHDANFMTFHRFKNFREMTTSDSVPTPPPD